MVPRSLPLTAEHCMGLRCMPFFVPALVLPIVATRICPDTVARTCATQLAKIGGFGAGDRMGFAYLSRSAERGSLAYWNALMLSRSCTHVSSAFSGGYPMSGTSCFGSQRPWLKQHRAPVGPPFLALLSRSGGGEAAVEHHLGRGHRHGPLHGQQHPRDPRVHHAQLTRAGEGAAPQCCGSSACVGKQKLLGSCGGYHCRRMSRGKKGPLPTVVSLQVGIVPI